MSKTPIYDSANKLMRYRSMDEGILLEHIKELELQLWEVTGRTHSLPNIFNNPSLPGNVT